MTKRNSLEQEKKEYLLQYLSEKERQVKAARIALGLKRAREQGKVIISRVPFGYRSACGKLQIDVQEGKVVEKVFQCLAAEKSYKDVSNLLNSQGYFYKNRPWTSSKIRIIAKSPIYIGELYFNKTTTRFLDGEKSQTIKNPQSEWQKISVPSIVKPELFNRVQKILSMKKDKKIKLEENNMTSRKKIVFYHRTDVGSKVKYQPIGHILKDQLYNIDEYFIDESYSGISDPFKRGSFEKLKNDIESGMIGKMVIKDYNRISRKNEDLARVLDFLRTNGVEVVICN
ncbi:recombinase family protein [Bacillus sp. J37]|uniref:recombinase family protein n=1 Tax=Bacillus sp. J37 TaxID=935837 RepID=UPI00047EDC2C|nr:recombinase family protein [Bacillus sp. J37]